MHQADGVKKKQLQRYLLLVRANALHQEKVARHEQKLAEEEAQALARTATSEALKQERTRTKLQHQVLCNWCGTGKFSTFALTDSLSHSEY